MQSLRQLYKIGRGPSSSHSIGPDRASREFRSLYPGADRFSVTLYGSLAHTGKGHMTDKVIREAFLPVPSEIIFDRETECEKYQNTMDLRAYKDGTLLGSGRVYSIGGGDILWEREESDADSQHTSCLSDTLDPPGMSVESDSQGQSGSYSESDSHPEVYPHNSLAEISAYCQENNIRIWQYAEKYEGKEIWDYLSQILNTMRASVNRGLSAEGELEGGLHTQRRAKHLFRQRHMDETRETRENRIVCAYAFAASEENAAGGEIVTAPTCGSCGVVPAVLCYMQDTRGFSDTELLHALATGGIIGNLIKTNASVSGAECGCQAEIGSACSMASAALAELFEMDSGQIDYAAEVALEHHLGLTCDPIGGLVQIPCIERNAVAAMRALNAMSLANFLADSRKISFDMVVRVMFETGRDLMRNYRETGIGGLAKYYEPYLLRDHDSDN